MSSAVGAHPKISRYDVLTYPAGCSDYTKRKAEEAGIGCYRRIKRHSVLCHKGSTQGRLEVYKTRTKCKKNRLGRGVMVLYQLTNVPYQSITVKSVIDL